VALVLEHSLSRKATERSEHSPVRSKRPAATHEVPRCRQSPAARRARWRLGPPQAQPQTMTCRCDGAPDPPLTAHDRSTGDSKVARVADINLLTGPVLNPSSDARVAHRSRQRAFPVVDEIAHRIVVPQGPGIHRGIQVRVPERRPVEFTTYVRRERLKALFGSRSLQAVVVRTCLSGSQRDPRIHLVLMHRRTGTNSAFPLFASEIGGIEAVADRELASLRVHIQHRR